MRYTLLIFTILILGACSTAKKLPEEKGTACIIEKDQDKGACYSARLYLNPVRFHYLRPWQEKSLGSMPSIP